MVLLLGFNIIYRGFSGGTSGKEPTCQCWRHERPRFDPWVGKIPWRRAWQPTPVFLPGESHGQRRLEGYSPWGHKESDTAEHLTLLLVTSCLFQSVASIASEKMQGFIPRRQKGSKQSMLNFESLKIKPQPHCEESNL